MVRGEEKALTTLFESHLTYLYCISVWGGAQVTKTSTLWLDQKHCARVLFGDKEAFLEKFRTAVRCRPFNNQMLCEEFYKREHTKPLFRKHHIMSFQNLYVYHTFMETFKILKFRSPISVHSMFNISKRKGTTLITPFPSTSFVYIGPLLCGIPLPRSSTSQITALTLAQ